MGPADLPAGSGLPPGLRPTGRRCGGTSHRHTAGGKRDPCWAAAAERDRLAERYQPTGALVALSSLKNIANTLYVTLVLDGGMSQLSMYYRKLNDLIIFESFCTLCLLYKVRPTPTACIFV